jgi:hypothetical protein
MKEPELTRLRAFFDLDEEVLAEARRGAEGTFAWNVAIEDAELAGWTLVSDQFVQVGDNQQLSTGLWENEAGVVVRTDVQAYRDISATVGALVSKLAATQTGTYLRAPPERWTGLRFRSEDGTSVVCWAANLLVALMLVEGGDADLVALSDEMVDSILSDAGGTEEETASGGIREAGAGALMPHETEVAGAAAGGAAEEFRSILTPPPDTRTAWPVTRTDRPTRVVVKSGSGGVFLRDDGLPGLSRAARDTKVAVTLKPPGAMKRRRMWLNAKMDDDR